jgi:hypothetical protein
MQPKRNVTGSRFPQRRGKSGRSVFEWRLTHGASSVKTGEKCTYHNAAIAMAMNLIGDVDGATSVLCHSNFTLLVWLELPDGVLVFWVLLQLFRSQWRHF